MIASPLIRSLAYFPAKLYEQGVRTRLALYQRRILKTEKLQAPVISVGNITHGGTGKTPCVAFIGKFLQAEGHNVAILSRGYKRESSGRVEVSNGQSILCSAREAGDEPYLLAMKCPGVRVVVDKHRAEAGRWIESQTPISAFILDDGFQHIQLARDLNLLLIDATDPFGGEKMAPFGRLREPMASISRADAVIITRSDQVTDTAYIQNRLGKYCRPGIPVFHAFHKVTGFRLVSGSPHEKLTPPSAINTHPVAALSCIANHRAFLKDLEQLGANIVFDQNFGDHHRYRAGELSSFALKAQNAGAEKIITTEKDLVNLPAEELSNSVLPVYISEIEFKCREEEELKNLIRAVLKK